MSKIRFLLIAVLFFAVVPVRGEAQNYFDVILYASADGHLEYDHWWWFTVVNGDDQSTLEMFMVMQLPVPPNHIYLPTELYDGWEAELTWERDGTTTITFEAQPGKELYAGQAKGFWVWIWGATGTGEGGYCAVGNMKGRCDRLPVAAWN